MSQTGADIIDANEVEPDIVWIKRLVHALDCLANLAKCRPPGTIVIPNCMNVQIDVPRTVLYSATRHARVGITGITTLTVNCVEGKRT
ncbi:MAG: hypothetical protein JPMHGGIA_00998 [Saprospiraceae bacterium]|nr:hypothetical protein [Saprospiraceae bacterium]